MSRSIQAACALSRDKFSVLRIEGEWEDTEDHQILFVESHKPPKVAKRQGRNVRISRESTTSDTIAVLSQRGGVEFISFSGESLRHEDITGAIASGKRAPRYGFLAAITCIDDHLFACGMGGQVYERIGVDNWSLISQTLLTDPYERDFSNIQGLNLSHVFVDGLAGMLYYYDGTRWELINTRTDSAIGEMIFYKEDTIYIAGLQSNLLIGNVGQGFRPMVLNPRGLDFYTICHFGGRLFLGTQQGLYGFEPTTLRLELVRNVDRGDIFSLQAIDNVMWCFATKFVLRFDGTDWERFDQIF